MKEKQVGVLSKRLEKQRPNTFTVLLGLVFGKGGEAFTRPCSLNDLSNSLIRVNEGLQFLRIVAESPRNPRRDFKSGILPYLLLTYLVSSTQ